MQRERRLEPADEANLVLDHPGQVNVFLVAGLLTRGGFVGGDGVLDMTAVRGTIARRVQELPTLRQLPVRAGRHHAWGEREPDLEAHVRLIPPLGSRDDLERRCGDLMIEPLPLTRPLCGDADEAADRGEDQHRPGDQLPVDVGRAEVEREDPPRHDDEDEGCARGEQVGEGPHPPTVDRHVHDVPDDPDRERGVERRNDINRTVAQERHRLPAGSHVDQVQQDRIDHRGDGVAEGPCRTGALPAGDRREGAHRVCAHDLTLLRRVDGRGAEGPAMPRR
ncbi:wax ester/triacylglycerol synthase domain-containing protein [Microbacterium atlanticum]|uniref:wax ester/triacylglycerol synthase domain-containing protein n=1 Tax=Microbacterium atlanticum TaxID=2782168 RepID=UPI001889134B|nr:wax ester/triacylglycerol synthase domain-containing protein [Microbacterium atlanticum]